MFNSITDAKNFLFNSGWVDVLDYENDEMKIATDLYHNARDEEHANKIIESYVV